MRLSFKGESIIYINGWLEGGGGKIWLTGTGKGVREGPRRGIAIKHQ